MLISLSPLGNLSRYIRRTEQVRVHETALLLVDGTSLSCSGAILAARSRVLEKVLEQDYEIVLEGFEGMIPQINQCLEVLYGGNVLITHDNIIPFLKFGITFQIDELVNICCVWLQDKELYKEIEVFLDSDLEKRLKLLDKLAPRVRQHSAGSAGSSLSSLSSNQDISPPSSSPDNSPSASIFSNNIPEEGGRWAKNPEFRSVSEDRRNVVKSSEIRTRSGPPARSKVSGDSHLVPLVSKMRCDDEREWKRPGTKHLKPISNKGGAKFSYNFHDEEREEQGQVPAPVLGGNLNDLDSMDDFPVLQKGWQLAPKKKSTRHGPPRGLMPAPPGREPSPQYCPDLARWREFSASELQRLCSSDCVYPEFVKLEVTIAWITTNNQDSSSWQECLTLILDNMNPAQLSDRYLGMVEEHLSGAFGLRLPDKFVPHIGDPYVDEVPGSGSKFIARQWSVHLAEELTMIRNDKHMSFFAACGNLCQKKSKQEVVWRLTNTAPCYDLNTDKHRKKHPRSGLSLPDHYHPNSVFHWFIRNKKTKRYAEMVSLITTEYKEVIELIKNNDYFKVVCLQINKSA